MNLKKKIYTITPRPTSLLNVTCGICIRRCVESNVTEILEQVVIGRGDAELVDCLDFASCDEMCSSLFCACDGFTSVFKLFESRNFMPFLSGVRRKISSINVFSWALIKFKMSISGIVTTLCLPTNIK